MIGSKPSHGPGGPEHRSMNDLGGWRQCQKLIRHITSQRDTVPTEEQTQRSNSQRQKTTGRPPKFDGCPTTRNLWWSFDIRDCLLSRLNHSSSLSQNCSIRHSLVGSDLSGSGNESAQLCGSMNQYHRKRSTHRTTDESTTNQCGAPTECPACDSTNINEENGLWHCGFCDASGGCRGGERT